MIETGRHGNKILERLPEQDFGRIVGLMEKVCPDVGTVVAFPDKEPKWVHFPISGVLSSMVVLEDGSTVEASTIGNEGMDGLYLLADPLTARVLQQANLIKYHRGELTIVDRAGLEETSCECFSVTSQMYERMMRLS